MTKLERTILVFKHQKAPDTNAVLHYQGALPALELTSPIEITLQCGCRCTI